MHYKSIIGFVSRHTEALCAGLCGTTVIPGTQKIAEQMARDPIFTQMSRSNVFLGAIRYIGYAILLFLKYVLDAAVGLLNNVYKLFTFNASIEVDSYIAQLIPLLWIPFAISIIILGYQLILNSKDRPDANRIVQNLAISIILITGIPLMLNLAGEMTQSFVTADINKQDKNSSNQIIASNLTDYTFLYDWDQQIFVQKTKTVTDPKNNTSRELNVNNSFSANEKYDAVSLIDINEQMTYWNTSANPDYSSKGAETWDKNAWTNWLEYSAYGNYLSQQEKQVDSLCWLATIVSTDKDGNYQCEHINELKWWEFFGDGYYYRYDIDYWPCLIELAAMALAIIYSSIKVCRILWELAVYRVLAMFFAAGDLHNGNRMKEIIKATAAAFIVIAVNAILLKFFTIFSVWLTSQNFDGFTKSIMLIAVAVAVIDGPNLVQKLIGVDAGLRSAAATIGSIYAAGKIAKGVGKTGAKVGSEVKEFGQDVARKGAAVGGFTAGLGVKGVSSIYNKVQEGKTKTHEQRQHDKQTARTDRAVQNAVGASETERQERTAAVQKEAVKSSGKGNTDTVDNYTDAARKLYSGNSDSAEIGRDAFVDTHGEQLIDEAAQTMDEANAGGAEMTEKDALTSVYRGKHNNGDDSGSADGTYSSSTQQTKNRIDRLIDTQAAQGNSVQGARQRRYEQIGENAKMFTRRAEYSGATEIDAHTEAAANLNGRTTMSRQAVDRYQGNMSAALTHRNEIMSKAGAYMQEHNSAPKKTQAEGVGYVLDNATSYGIDPNSEQAKALETAMNDYQNQANGLGVTVERGQAAAYVINHSDRYGIDRTFADHIKGQAAEYQNSSSRRISMEEAVSHVVANENDYQMSYGFDSQYADDVAAMLTAQQAEPRQRTSDSPSTKPSETSSSTLPKSNINNNATVNRLLAEERRAGNKPKRSAVQSAKAGFSFGRGKKKK